MFPLSASFEMKLSLILLKPVKFKKGAWRDGPVEDLGLIHSIHVVAHSHL